MKKILLLFSLCIPSAVIAQLYDEDVATKACECIYNATNDTIDAVINSCLMKALLHSLEEDGISQETILEDFAGKKNIEPPQAVFSEYLEMLYRKCFAIQFLIEKKAKRYSNISDSEEANHYYREGVDYLKQNDFPLALLAFHRALNDDSLFVAAIDSVGIIYSREGMPEAAIEYCQRSLQIFPEGYTALANLAQNYLLNGETQESFKIYARLIKYFAKDPEGYFGMGSISFLNEDYPAAAQLMKHAYDIYSQTNADRASECRDYLKIAYYYMKEEGQDSLFIAIAGEEFIPPLYPPGQFSQLQNMELINEIDCRLMEPQMLLCAGYILSSPVNMADKNRTYAINAVKRWMAATPDYSYNIEKNVAKILDKEGNVMSVFVTAMTQFSIENPDQGNDRRAVSWYAWNTVLDYASNPANNIKLTGELKKMIKAKKKGTLAKQLGYNEISL